jgi:NACHT domain
VSPLAEAFKDKIARDLIRFADRGTEPTFELDGNLINAAWTSQGKKREALFAIKPGNRLRWASAGDARYDEFLASEDMAGFKQLASACQAMIEGEPAFVASEAVIENGGDPTTMLLTPEALTELIDEARTHAEESSTQLIFLKGDAGAGKTTLLRETTLLQAQRYLAGESEFLCLYVPAQGRELSNLRDAFAGELDELRAVFTNAAIASLASEGILVPVIDGFDELLGTAGYSGAFSSLQSFLAELEGYGTLVVSARSAFYDVEFNRVGARRPDAAIRITTAEMLPWSDEQLRDYLTRPRVGRDPEVAVAALDELRAGDRELLRRPFFASQFGQIVARTESTGEIDLVDSLIDAYIERESRKILDSHDEPVLPVDGHRYLFELAVEEMWDHEVRQLTETDLRTIAELAAEKFDLDQSQAMQLITKVTSYAGFRPRRGTPGDQSSFALEHEVYFEHFLGCAIGRRLREESLDELVTLLDRGVITEAVAAGSLKRMGDGQRLPASLFRCSAGVTFDNRRRNLGSLVLAYARDTAPVADATLQGLSFMDVAAGAARFARVNFDTCQFLNADLSQAAFDDCDGSTSDFDGITLTSATAFGITGLHPGGNVRRVHHDPPGDVYIPEAIASVLTALGAAVDAEVEPASIYSEHAQELIDLLQRLPRAFRQSTHLYETDDRRHQAIRSSPHWPELRRLLVDHGILEHEMREAKGANVPAYRLRANIDELVAGERGAADPQSSTAQFWRALRTL